MSWDLVYWKGAPLEEPPAVWTALADDLEVRFVAPLSTVELQRAFRAEYGEDMHINADDTGVTLVGRGWEGHICDGAIYLYLNCSWGLVEDDEWLTQIVRAGLRAGCYVLDPQSNCWWEPTRDPDWRPEDFDVWGSVRDSDDE